VDPTVSTTNLAPIRHLVPLGAENRWSDLLAAMIETDPLAVAALLGLGASPSDVVVQREAMAGGRDRIDLVISADGQQCCVAEAKVLSGLGLNQLQRYRDAYPDSPHYVLISAERLPIHVPSSTGWRSVHWEELLRSLAGSGHAWVADTAAAWLAYVTAAMPHLSADTRWNDLRPGEGFVVAMRARMAWVYQHLRPPALIEHDLVSSSAGQSWVVRLYAPAQKSGYWVYVEAEERLSVRSYPKFAGDPNWGSMRGPSVKVCLLQTGVHSSKSFDWDYLLSMWPTMAAARSDWVTTRANPKAPHDREAWQRMVAKGGPPYLGIGFGESQAKSSGECMFGARYQMAPDIALSDLARALNDTTQLILDLVAIPGCPVES
jgi:hypothetical protein